MAYLMCLKTKFKDHLEIEVSLDREDIHYCRHWGVHMTQVRDSSASSRLVHEDIRSVHLEKCLSLVSEILN